MMAQRCNNPCAKNNSTARKPEENVVLKHEKDRLLIYITIYNTNNNANLGSEAGLRKDAQRGGQIAEKCGKNANQDSEGFTESDERDTDAIEESAIEQ